MKEMDERINKLVKKWLESLEETERAQAEVLDAYFLFRRPLPEDDPGFGKAVADPKTTQDIIDELQPMMLLSEKMVVDYMRVHGYGFTTLQDGSVRWAVWRFVDITGLT